jgi:hypothetical protein
LVLVVVGCGERTGLTNIIHEMFMDSSRGGQEPNPKANMIIIPPQSLFKETLTSDSSPPHNVPSSSRIPALKRFTKMAKNSPR